MFPKEGDSPLGAESRRGWIKTNIPFSVWRSMSGAAILGTLQEQGLGIRKTDFLAIRREVLGRAERENVFFGDDPDGLVALSKTYEDHGFDMTMQGQYRFLVDVVDEETGKLITLDRVMASNRHYTIQEAEDMMSGLMSGPLAQYGLQLVGVTLDDVYVTPGGRLMR